MSQDLQEESMQEEAVEPLDVSPAHPETENYEDLLRKLEEQNRYFMKAKVEYDGVELSILSLALFLYKKQLT